MERNVTIGDTSLPFYHWKDRRRNGKESVGEETEIKDMKEEGVEKE